MADATWPMSGATTSNLNLRQSGSTNSSVLTVIPKGAAVSITGPAVNGWYPVSYGGKTGWASASYFGTLSAPTPTPAPTAQTGTTKSNLNLRASGSTSSNVLTVIPKGASVNVTGPAVNGWYPVSYNGKTGWASAAYFNPLTSPPVTTPSTDPIPAPIPHTQAGSNPFYSPGSTYGGTQNWYDTPFVTDSMSAQNPQGEYEKWITDQGFGGVNRIGGAARNLYERAQSGFSGASLNNPNLSFRSYLNDMLGPNFLQTQINSMTDQQLGNNTAAYSPRIRWVTR